MHQRRASFETAASRPPQDEVQFLMPFTNAPHPEERRAAARLEGRTTRDPAHSLARFCQGLIETAALPRVGLIASRSFRSVLGDVAAAPAGMQSDIWRRDRVPGRKMRPAGLGCRSRGCGFGTTHEASRCRGPEDRHAADLRIASLRPEPGTGPARPSAARRVRPNCLWGAAGAAGRLPGASGPGTAAGAG